MMRSVWVVTIEPYHDNSIVVMACATESLAQAYVAAHAVRVNKRDQIYYADPNRDGQFDITEVPFTSGAESHILGTR